MSQENVEIVRRAVDAYNRRDFDALTALNHPEIEVDWSASLGLEAQIYRGQDEAISFYNALFEAFERVHLTPERFIESGASVVVPFSGQFRGRDGIETVARSTLVFEVRGDRVVRIRLYQEMAEALEAAGLRE